MKLFKLSIFLFITIFFISCNSSDSSHFDAVNEEKNLLITGLVKDYTTQTLMEDVTIEISTPAAQELITDINGSYQVKLDTDTDYSLNFSKANFHPITYILNTAKETQQTLETVYLVPISTISTSGASGIITSTSTNEPLANVTLSLRQGINNKVGDIIASTSSLADGTYNFNDIPIDTYTMQISLREYEVNYELLYVIGAQSGEGQNFAISPQVFALDGNNTISGTITSATTADVLEGVALTLREGTDTKTGTIIGRSKTITDGTYELINLPTGSYTMEMLLDGYVTEYGNIDISESDNGEGNNFVLSPTLKDDEIMRIILTWGDTPSDLDGTLLLSMDDGSDNNISHNSKNLTYGGTTYGVLDIDDQTGYGPETITINYFTNNGNNIYYIHDYHSTNKLNISDAKVQIIRDNEETIVIEINTTTSGSKYYWEVFHIDNGVITIINEIKELAPTL